MTRNRIAPLIASVLILAFAGASNAADAPKASGKPNIIFVLFDDLGWPQVPAFRAETPFKMPSMDRMNREGMRFTDAHSAAAVCTPTRYGVITGRYPMRIGQFGVLTTFAAPIIDPNRMTIGSMLKSAGYNTACFGKWHLGMKIHAQGKATGNELPIGTNIGTDLSEKHDVVADNPAIVEKLTALMQHYIDTGRSTPGAPQAHGRQSSARRFGGGDPAAF